MSDELDAAQDLIEATTDKAIAKARAEAAKVIVTTGQCAWCGEPGLPEGHRWCDHECRDLWQMAKDRSW